MSANHDLVHVLPVACFTCDAAGRLVAHNDAAAALWGRRPPPGQLEWWEVCRLFRPDGRQMARDDSPVFAALEAGRSERGREALVERADGRSLPVLLAAAPQRDAAGRITGATVVLAELPDRTFEELELERLAAIVASSDDAIISKTLDGRITSWNAGATRIFGYTADEMIGQPITRIIPPELHQDEVDILGRLRRGEHIDHFDTVRLAKDGRRIDISLTVSPLRNRVGAIVGASKVARDISDRRRHEQDQLRLIDELNHRVKNTLASVQALANQSLRRAHTPVDFVASFSGRIHALAQVHDLLVQQKMLGVELGVLVRELVVRGFADDQRIDCAGPPLVLNARSAVQMGLVLHELGVNARKHGALAGGSGRLAIEWRVRPGVTRALELKWRESGLHAVRAPTVEGFGTTLIDSLLKASAGTAVFRYADDGLTCEIFMPLLSSEEMDGTVDAAARDAATDAVGADAAGLLR